MGGGGGGRGIIAILQKALNMMSQSCLSITRITVPLFAGTITMLVSFLGHRQHCVFGGLAFLCVQVVSVLRVYVVFWPRVWAVVSVAAMMSTNKIALWKLQRTIQLLVAPFQVLLVVCGYVPVKFGSSMC